jgi:FMN phosphatase YigB (HAD superfamily)
MSRPLIVSDCDEVLLYMVAPFRDWLAERHGVIFDMSGGDFGRAMTYAAGGAPVDAEEIWRLLNLFFDGEMHRQSPVPGVIDAVAALREHADVVVLTNLKDFRQEARTRQLAEHGLDLRVFTNQGPKGPALKAILDEYRPSRAVFIDDLAQHHGSAAELVPHVGRLHLCAEPMLAPHIDCAHRAGHAHARIDDWASALPWLLDRLHAEQTAEETA